MILKPQHCNSCVGKSWPDKGFVPASGTGDNGVLVVAEAAGEDEQKDGVPLIGRSGHFLWTNLLAAGIDREGFRVHNVLSCRPPKNKLLKTPYEMDAISSCAPFLDATIYDQQQKCKQMGRTFVILALGKIAFKRILGLGDKDSILKEDYACYPFFSHKYQAWVLGLPHPSHVMQGNTRLVPILQFGFQRALEIAEHGLTLDKPNYLLDPDPATFAGWVADYLRDAADNPEETYLSYDIETPYKSGKNEDQLSREEDQDSWQILRCSFAHRPGEAVSIPWTANYLPYVEELFTAPFTKLGWNNSVYDSPRVRAKVSVGGSEIDGMQCWHVLNSALDKSLGFVTPFYVTNTELWKHLSNTQPAFYNAKDADMALRNFLGAKRDLKKNGQWKVIDRHIIQLNTALSYMSRKGVLLDQGMRGEAEEKLSDLLKVTDMAIESSIPEKARKQKLYKKEPKDLTGMLVEERPMPMKVCPVCGEVKPGKKHAKLCPGGITTSTLNFPQKVWLKPLEFKVSHQGLSKYQEVLQHEAILSRKEKKVTFDEEAIVKLMRKYPSDLLYPKIIEHREIQTLLTRYVGVTKDGRIVGGMPTKEDGRVHTIYTHNPSTLRLASEEPNLQNLPRPQGENDLATIIRNLIIPAPGNILHARDYSGIEAVLVGYFACSPSYIRLAKIDVHSFYTAYALNQLDGRVRTADLPELHWSDEKLKSHLAGIKAEFKKDRNTLYKHLVHGANFMQGPLGARDKVFSETRIEYPVKLVSKVMDIYFELFPEIRRWHQVELLQANDNGYCRNPFNYVHRFYHVYKWTKVGGKWEKSPGSDANKVIAFKPQSTAAAIIKEAILRLFFQRFEEAGQYLRLQVHDELFNEVPEGYVNEFDVILKEEMERPIVEMPLPASYNMGQYLTIDTEAKSGYRWGSMK